MAEAVRSTLNVPDDVNRDQRRAANPNSSAWVAASAGTGKTKVLTDRVLRLLLAGSNPEDILCLTYTRAAAAEMSNRIAMRLASWATLPLEAAAEQPSLTSELAKLGIAQPQERDFSRARTLFASMLDCAGGMKIQTIHSFCQSLLARFPLEAGLPPGFTVLDDHAANVLARETLEILLADAGRHTNTPFAMALHRLLRRIGDRRLKELLTGEVIGKREALMAFERQEFMQSLADELGIAVDLVESDVTARAASDVPSEALRELAQVTAGSTSKTDQKLGNGLFQFLELDQAEQIAAWNNIYIPLFLTAKSEIRSRLPTQKICKDYPQIADIFQREAQRVLGLQSWQLKARLLEINRDFYIVAQGWLDKLEMMKRRQALLDFDDLVRITRNLLNDQNRAAWILYKLGYEVKHLLVDEAQDTSQTQWDIVKKLTEEFFVGDGATKNHTLFVVGDEKQSIYSFNGADPAAFNEARFVYADAAKVGESIWEDVPLSLSFRSTGAVLDVVNEVFADPAIRQGVSHAVVDQRPARSYDSGLVELWSPLLAEEKPATVNWALPLARQPQTTPSIQLARLIAGRIKQWLATGEMLAARGRPITPGDIMVLVPRRNVFFAQLVRALKEQHIPVAGVDRMIITEQLVVQDLLALLNFLILPDDDLNLAALLKTPLFALSEEDLFSLCHSRDGTVWQALAQQQDKAPFKEIYAYLAMRRNQVDRLRPYELLQTILNEPCPADAEGSVRRALWQRLGNDALDPIDELVAEALRFEEQHIPTLQHFIAWLTEDEIDKKRDLSQTTGQVRIMTAHASKGMEAPIVFVVDLPSARGKSSSLLEGDNGAPLMFLPYTDWKDDVAADRRTKEALAQAEENRRLLYVALTRAEDRLYICGAYPKKMPDNAWYHAVLPALQKLGQEAAPSEEEQKLGLTQIWRYETEQQVAVKTVTSVKEAEDILQLPSWAVQPITPPTALSRPLAPSRIMEPEVAVLSPGGPGAMQRFQRGNLTHALLQYLPDWPEAKRHDAAVSYLQRNAGEIDTSLRASIIDEVMAIIEHPDYAELFGPQSQAEVPLVGIVGGHPISSRVDRLLVTPEKVQLVDYKTNRPPPVELEKVPTAYAAQMAVYAALLQQIYPGRTLEIGLLWTDGPRLVDLPLDFLNGFLPKGVILEK